MNKIIPSICFMLLTVSTIADAKECVAAATSEKLLDLKLQGYTLSFTCKKLDKSPTDLEFAMYIGEEEPEEAPPLKKYGSIRGRQWITQDQHREWHLLINQYYVHMVLIGNNTNTIQSTENMIESIIQTITVTEL